MAVWNTATPPPPNAKRKPAVIIAAGVAAISLVGGGFALANVVKGDPDAPPPPTIPAVTAIDPADGPAPAPLAPSLPGPSIPAPTTVSAQPPTTQPSPASDTDFVELVGGVILPVPSGWSVSNQSDTSVLLQTDGADFRVIFTEAPANQSADALVSEVLTSLISDEVADLSVGDITVDSPPTASVVSAASAAFEGTIATTQSSAPVEGLVFAFVGQDGLAMVVDTLNLAGSYDEFEQGYNQMLVSLLTTF
jgi:hypothetical protein